MINPWLEINKPENSVNVRRIDDGHPLDFFWARDSKDNYLMLYKVNQKTSSVDKKIPNIKGIEVFYQETDKDAFLIFLLKNKVDWEIFRCLCDDLIRCTYCESDIGLGFEIILSRLSRWRELLRNGRPKILKEHQIKGLIGELLFILNILYPKYTISQSVNFWFGPEGTSQDFCVDKCAIEVKCQNGLTKPTVRISSVDQLWSQLPELCLYVVTLAFIESDDCPVISLPNIIDKILHLLAEENASDAITRFNDLVFSAGYVYDKEYDNYKYSLVCDKMYKVEGDFPRIQKKYLINGIVNLTYDIDLDKCIDYEFWPEWSGRKQ